MIVKAVICVVCNFVLLFVNIGLIVLKPDFLYDEEHPENYAVYFPKWLRIIIVTFATVGFFSSIYFALKLRVFVSVIILLIEGLLVIIYALCKYKKIIIDKNNIEVERLFRKNLKLTYDDITNIIYYPDAKMVINPKKNNSFEVSFSSVNFEKFYFSLIEKGIKFKTGPITRNQNHVFIPAFDMVIDFPKKMFREFFKSSTFLRNSNYLFSARDLEANEHLEAYIKESGKNRDEFIILIRNDLSLNGFNVVDEDTIQISNFNFDIISSLDSQHKNICRNAYILKKDSKYLVIYADYEYDNQEEFNNKINKAIRESNMLDNQSGITVVK